MKPSRVRWLLLFVLFGTTPSGPFCVREEEFLCEEASSHLASCCGHTPPMHCIDEEACGTLTFPDLQSTTARCLMEQSCDALKRAGACDVSSWSLGDRCNVKSGNCPPTSGCQQYRPADACAALARLSCQ